MKTHAWIHSGLKPVTIFEYRIDGICRKFFLSQFFSTNATNATNATTTPPICVATNGSMVAWKRNSNVNCVKLSFMNTSTYVLIVHRPTSFWFSKIFLLNNITQRMVLLDPIKIRLELNEFKRKSFIICSLAYSTLIIVHCKDISDTEVVAKT